MENVKAQRILESMIKENIKVTNKKIKSMSLEVPFTELNFCYETYADFLE